ncbi:MAG: acetyl-CoA carboxylase biotin carboxyl carrier protein [Oscillospiraceae bacterium]|jgi:acetyl-CoA carboxylase biotin carboxyl carrier protein|nr:acetyl-CoA carboxylase biotin carboxyl carrier protein [Oscillospiraceae bacterium]
MDFIKTARELADLLYEKNLGSINVKNGNTEICITAKFCEYNVPLMPATAQEIPVATAPAVPDSPAEQSGNFVKSPIIGTFYAAPAPDKPPFVKVGDKVEKGQVVCIVESMKLMNEITSEFSGTVAEILAKDGEAVEFDRKLIRIE